MNMCESYFTETVLDFLINQICAVWNSENYVISLLVLNITEAFNCMLHECLMHVLKIKKMSARLVIWIHIFMSEHFIIIMLAETESEKFQMSAEMLQEFLLSSILYLFYITELLEICNSFQDRFSANAFVNDIIFLIYRFFTEWNCCILECAHDWYLKSVCRYEVIFVSDKYDLIHLSNKFNKFNMQIFIQLDAVIKNSKTEVRILEIWIDLQLK